jgi:succinate dehydrogenase flavin-adding protein (antitoxin of CptAB toxin-antitoxin module)
MLELDVALQSFVTREFDNLSSAQRDQFAELLQSPDDLLWSYLFGGVVPLDAATAELVDRIKASAGP